MLNIAGNRGSKLTPAFDETVRTILSIALKDSMYVVPKEESPFISDEKDVFSTEPQGVAELVDEFGIKTSDDWTKLTAEQRRKLEEKYKHCKGII